MKQIKPLIRPYWYWIKELIRNLNFLLIKPIQKLPISSEKFGPPKGHYESTSIWLAENKLDKSQIPGIYREIYPKHVIYRSAPQTLDETVHWKFKIEYRCESPASFVAVVPNGRVWVNKGPVIDCNAVITENDQVLSDLSLEFRRASTDHSIFTQWKLPQVHYVEGIAVVLTSAKANIYFHWMTDLLPRIELLRHSGIRIETIDKFIVNSYSYPFQKETLIACGIPSSKIIESSKYPHIKATQLIVPSLPGISGNPPLWVCNFLRKEFLPLAVVKQPYSSSLLHDDRLQLPNQALANSNKLERIYISRDNAKYRRVINEIEVIACLEELGFKSLKLESISLAEQLSIFASAKIVVAPHGAGLTNIVFCQPGTKVIELFSPKYVNVCYWSLANQVSLDYYYLLGEGQNPPEGIDPHLEGEDILINLSSLEEIIELATITCKS